MKSKTTPGNYLGLLMTAALFVSSVASYANGPAPSRAQANYEIHFMERMIDHHAMAVMMAMVCTNKAVHPELEQTCENIIVSQSAEIEQLQTWLRGWYGINYEPQTAPGDEKKVQRLATLSVPEFEIEFMQEMIRHHEKAVKEGLTCLDRAYHSKLIQLCENIVQSQSSEIVMMQNWLCQWYGICKPR